MSGLYRLVAPRPLFVAVTGREEAVQRPDPTVGEVRAQPALNPQSSGRSSSAAPLLADAPAASPAANPFALPPTVPMGGGHIAA